MSVALSASTLSRSRWKRGFHVYVNLGLGRAISLSLALEMVIITTCPHLVCHPLWVGCLTWVGAGQTGWTASFSVLPTSWPQDHNGG